MEIFEGHRALLRPLVTPAVALGNFDGVHLGHRALLARAAAAAQRSHGDAVAFTFAPHPAKVLAPAYAPQLITTAARKLELLAASGIDVCITEPFTLELAALPPEEFVRQILVDCIGAAHVVVGYDFTFGHKRAGTTELLRELGRRWDFEVEIVEPVTIDGIVASSTKVRNFVSQGNLAGARLLLGRPLDLDGVVVRGAGRGRTIGVPTANLEHRAELLPNAGVYAVQVQLDDGRCLPGAANLGTNPTFVADGGLSLEVHLLDFDEELYGQHLRVQFIERLRGERRFTGVDELVAQIHQDIARARESLTPSPT